MQEVICVIVLCNGTKKFREKQLHKYKHYLLLACCLKSIFDLISRQKIVLNDFILRRQHSLFFSEQKKSKQIVEERKSSRRSFQTFPVSRVLKVINFEIICQGLTRTEPGGNADPRIWNPQNIFRKFRHLEVEKLKKIDKSPLIRKPAWTVNLEDWRNGCWILQV